MSLGRPSLSRKCACTDHPPLLLKYTPYTPCALPGHRALSLLHRTLIFCGRGGTRRTPGRTGVSSVTTTSRSKDIFVGHTSHCRVSAGCRVTMWFSDSQRNTTQHGPSRHSGLADSGRRHSRLSSQDSGLCSASGQCPAVSSVKVVFSFWTLPQSCDVSAYSTV